ncbi:zinc-finger domain-containing protein [Brevundimonas sp.]|uniref:zinc-finger domain-containing protein n=1 Tax=Brevundimonas sp. TaxID=1871086 RepID=UPI0025F61752|nr:zinc-finger domain-containing protein [Brevundimonas sp.]
MPPRHPEVPVPPPEEIAVSTTRVACDGGGGALGHPLVYLDMGDETAVECGYCDRRFVLAQAAGAYHDPSPRQASGH